MSVQVRKVEAVSVLRADNPYPAMLLIGRLDAGAGGVASFDFQSIPATYFKLILDLYLRGDTAATSVTVGVVCNNDGAAIYDSVRYNIRLTTGLTISEQLAAGNFIAGSVAAANSTASVFDAARLEIPGYANANAFKVLLAEFSVKTAATTTNQIRGSSAGWYKSTNALSRLTITPTAGNWAQYSTARLYGVY